MKLSKREKILLYGLLCFLIAVGGIYFLILPALDTKTAREGQYADATYKKMQLENTLLQYGNLEEALKETETKITDMIANFQPMQEQEDIDALLTKLMKKNLLTPLSLRMDELTETFLPMFGEQGETKEDDTTIQAMSVSITFSGSIANMGKWMDEVNALPGYQIRSLHYQNNDPEAPISVSFVLYFIE